MEQELSETKSLTNARSDWIQAFVSGKVNLNDLLTASRRDDGYFLRKIRLIDILKKYFPMRVSAIWFNRFVVRLATNCNAPIKRAERYTVGWLIDERTCGVRLLMFMYMIKVKKGVIT